MSGCCLCWQGTFKEHAEIAREVAAGAPYKEWVNSNHRLEELVTATEQYHQETQMESAQVLRLQAANGALARVLVFSVHSTLLCTRVRQTGVHVGATTSVGQDSRNK